jgi:DNA helicase HerA-like ATPase
MFKPTDLTLTDCNAILGMRGCGKTHLGRNIQKIYPKIVIIDALKEYKESEERKLGGIIFSDFNEFCAALFEVKNKRKKRFRLIFQFNEDDENTELIFEQLIRVLYKCGNLVIVIEEIQLYSTPHKVSHWLRNLFLTGRHQNLGVIFTTQRPGELNKTILSQCAHLFVGQMHEKNDIKYISNFLGVDAEKLTELKKRFFLHWTPGGETSVIDNDFKIRP